MERVVVDFDLAVVALPAVDLPAVDFPALDFGDLAALDALVPLALGAAVRAALVPVVGGSAAGVLVDAVAVSRDERLSAARAFPAAVCSPFALVALPAAMRALAAFAAAALPVWRCDLVVAWSASPPRAASSLRISRLFRRSAAFWWMAPTLAALSRAETASRSTWRAWSASPVAIDATALAT